MDYRWSDVTYCVKLFSSTLKWIWFPKWMRWWQFLGYLFQPYFEVNSVCLYNWTFPWQRDSKQTIATWIAHINKRSCVPNWLHAHGWQSLFTCIWSYFTFSSKSHKIHAKNTVPMLNLVTFNRWRLSTISLFPYDTLKGSWDIHQLSLK